MQWNAISAIASSVSTIAIIAGGAIAIYQVRRADGPHSSTRRNAWSA
jgi:hypothetical protein